jgi:hypothetical protein
MRFELDSESFGKNFLKPLLPFSSSDQGMIFFVEEDSLYCISDYKGDTSNLLCSVVNFQSVDNPSNTAVFGINEVAKLLKGVETISKSSTDKKLTFEIRNGILYYIGDQYSFNIQLMNEFIVADKAKRIPFKKDKLLQYPTDVSFTLTKDEIGSIKNCISFSQNPFLRVLNTSEKCIFQSVASTQGFSRGDEMAFTTISKSDQAFDYLLNAEFLEYLPSKDVLVKVNTIKNTTFFYCIENDAMRVYVLSKIKN